MAYSSYETLQRVESDRVITVTLRTAFEQEGSKWVGTCVELGTSAYSDSLDEATAELRDAILLQVNEVAKLGYLDAYFKENGVQVSMVLLAGHTAAEWETPQPMGAGR